LKSQLYGYPELGRYGLAHGILAWARCVIWCEETGARMIAPIWLRPRIGPYLRRERDKRNYFLLFKDRRAITGISRALLLMTSAKREAGTIWPNSYAQKPGREIVVFQNALASNEAKYFHQIVGYGPLLRARLTEMTRLRYRPTDPAVPHIAIHVRLGDFVKKPTTDTLSSGVHNVQLPIHWYADRLIALREALGCAIPAIIYSDGADEDLSPLTAIASVTRAKRQHSVTDLLAMGHGIAVISSGSGFSLWGAFLGGAPRICYPGQMIVPAYNNPALEIESGLASPLPESFVRSVRTRLDG
jgi:hypothetical protein